MNPLGFSERLVGNSLAAKYGAVAALPEKLALSLLQAPPAFRPTYQLHHQKQAAYAELAEIERIAKTERERAERAESGVQSGEAQIKRLEAQAGCALLTRSTRALAPTPHGEVMLQGA